MQVFKLFFKTMKGNLPNVLIYFVITFVCALVFVKAQTTSPAFSSKEIKPSIVIKNQGDSEYAKGLSDYLKEKCVVIDVEEERIENALFYRQISYVLYLPDDFDAKVENRGNIDLQTKKVDSLSDSYLAEQYVTSYMSTLQGNLEYGNLANEKEVIKQTAKDLSKDVKITMLNGEHKEEVQYYFNFLSYTFCSCLIGGIGYVMFVLHKREIRRRNTVSPLKNTSMNLQLMLGYISYAVVMGLVAILFAYLIFPEGMKEAFGPYMVLNTFVSLVPALGLAYLVGTAIQSLEIQQGLSNVLCLIMAFLGGSFVPQQLLSDNLLKFSTFTPNYWFVKANDALYQIQEFDMEHLQPVFSYMGMQILFGVVFFLIAMIYSKQRRKNVV